MKGTIEHGMEGIQKGKLMDLLDKMRIMRKVYGQWKINNDKGPKEK